MKISKVNHVRTAVGICNNHMAGMMYKVPESENGLFDSKRKLEEHIQKLNGTAKRLYSVFSKVGDYPETREERSKRQSLQKEFERLTQGVLRYRGSVDDKLKYIRNYRVAQSIHAQEELIDSMIEVWLRKSLKIRVHLKDTEQQIEIQDVIKKLLEALNKGGEYSKVVNLIPNIELEAFIKVLEEDYRKNRQIAGIIKSIQKQNVKVQVNTAENTTSLMLSGAISQKARKPEHDKANIFNFIREYALADEDKRNLMLSHFRQLILLYYYGVQKYEDAKTTRMNSWNWSGLVKEEDGYFLEDFIKLQGEYYAVDNKIDKKAKKNEITKLVKQKIAKCYQDSKLVAEPLKPEDLFWLQYIERTAEKILIDNNNVLKERQQKLSYLCESTWREWLSFLSGKYIDMGKAVFHFAMPDLQNLPADAQIGAVLKEYQEGITSFDYERIQAEENLERAVSSYVLFAVHNFSQAVGSDGEQMTEKKEDILQLKPHELELRTDAKRGLMQFFGGLSEWKPGSPKEVSFQKAFTKLQPFGAASSFADITGKELTLAMQRELQMIRNTSFHYTGNAGTNTEAEPVIRALLAAEAEQAGELYRKMYASNNVLKFYSVNTINELMQFLYSAYTDNPAQIPSFARVLGRLKFDAMIPQIIGIQNWNQFDAMASDEDAGIFKSALYFLLKEIYYHGFLQNEKLKDYFIDALKSLKPKKKDERSVQTFKDRIRQINENPNIELGEICQQIMTDYEQQNQKNRKVRTSANEKDEYLYENYPILLNQCMQKAFINYLQHETKDNTTELRYGFLFSPENRSDKAAHEENNWNGDSLGMYRSLGKTADEDNILYAWYIMAHFLNGKYLNHLIGCLKTYIQYTESINTRAEITKNKVDDLVSVKSEKYKQILQILDLCRLYNGKISTVIEDYFADEEEYAEYLNRFIDFADEAMPTKKDALEMFCKRESAASPSGRIELFHNGQQPILNRNVALSRMYGNYRLLTKCLQPITEEEIQTYYKLMKEIQPEFRAGGTKEERRRRKMHRFQQIKNRIELFDIMIYSEVVNDLLGQLISWAYLRERDLMYFQLGFHYLQLFYDTERIPADDERRVLKNKYGGKEISIKDGALLYQIAALYTYSLPLYKKKGTAGGRTGAKIGAFCSLYNGTGEEVYMEGLSLFEYVAEHDMITAFRNYLAHFKYNALLDRSLLDLYSECYDRFFTYDTKLRKNVVTMFQNILAKNGVIANFTFAADKTNAQNDDKIKRRRSHIMLCAGEKGLISDTFTYMITKNGMDEKLDLQVRNKKYLNQLENILNYPYLTSESQE